MSLGAVGLFRPVISIGRGHRCQQRQRLTRVDFIFIVINIFLILSTLLTLCRCEQNIDECKIYPNCQNNGTCTDLVNGYNCTCTEDFTGDVCEFKVNQTCDSLSCKNGTCTKLNYTNNLGINYEVVNCTCDAGFEGRECELEIDFCQNVTCQNRGNCSANKARTGFQCNCDNDHEGIYCEKRIDHCASKPCYNNASCIDLVGNFDCKCLSGWKGNTCKEDIDECKNRTGWCLNNGVCTNLPGSFNCNCSGTGYGGSYCQFKGLCTDMPCKNGALCTQNYTAQTYTCHCTSGFKGENCSEDKNECTVNPCLHDGTCHNTFGSFECKCDSQKFMGKYCHIENPCSAEKNPCMNSANCTYTISENHSYANCSCPDGWQGPICAEKMRAGPDFNNLYLYIGIPLALLILAMIIGIVFFVLSARKKRATSGTYSPSQQEMSGARVELGNVMKIPPTERLI